MSDSAGSGVRPSDGAVGDGELTRLRAELDGIDDRLLDTIRERIAVCTRIAVVKRTHAIPVMQPHRVGAVHEHAREYARRHDLSPRFLRAVYELLIEETCRVEDRVVGEASASAPPASERDPD